MPPSLYLPPPPGGKFYMAAKPPKILACLPKKNFWTPLLNPPPVFFAKRGVQQGRHGIFRGGNKQYGHNEENPTQQQGSFKKISYLSA